MFNKRSSLEISIQAIVIVVLAMTILGLGLGFVRGLFKNISGTTEDVTEQVRQKVIDDLITGDKKVTFPKTEVTIDRGGSTVLTVGIRNKGDSEMTYGIKFDQIGNTPANVGDAWFQYGGTLSTYKLAAAESDVRNVRILVPTDALQGSYFFTFKVLNGGVGGTTYAEKDFFLVVRG